LIPLEDPEASKIIEDQFRKEGINLHTSVTAKKFERRGATNICLVEKSSGQTEEIEFDRVLVAVGRRPNTKDFGLEELGIPLTPNGQIEVDDYLRTIYPNIWAVGDVTGPYLFTHAASHQAWHAAVNALFGRFKKFKVDYSNLPWCTYTDPEVAHLGLNEQEAKTRNIAYQVFTYDMHHNDRAVADGTNYGFIKILLKPGTDQILGVTSVGPHAGDTIAEFVFAKRHGKGLNAIMAAIHSYPTLAEGNKMAAGVWKKATAPTRLLDYVQRYHRWQRG